ncbi:MAG: hypothetical protein U1F53_08255 [Burkholderiaceae bacterium]
MLLLATLVTALLVGQAGAAASRRTLAWAAMGLLAGLAATGLGWPLASPVPLLVAATAGGAWVLAARTRPTAARDAIAALLGAGIGLGAEPDGAAGLARAVTLLGTLAGTCVWVADGALVVEALSKRNWGRVLVRVLASWMTAGALLVLALQWAPPAKAPTRNTMNSGQHFHENFSDLDHRVAASRGRRGGDPGDGLLGQRLPGPDGVRHG